MRPGYDKAPCSDSTGKGCAEEENKHVHCGKLNMRNFCPTSASQHMCSSADKEDGDRHERFTMEWVHPNSWMEYNGKSPRD